MDNHCRFTCDAKQLNEMHTLRDPSNGIIGLATVPAVNQNAILQTAPTTTAGIYTLTIAGAGITVGGYTAQIILNAAEELERNAGQPTNDTAGTAQTSAQCS